MLCTTHGLLFSLWTLLDCLPFSFFWIHAWKVSGLTQDCLHGLQVQVSFHLCHRGPSQDVGGVQRKPAASQWTRTSVFREKGFLYFGFDGLCFVSTARWFSLGITVNNGPQQDTQGGCFANAHAWQSVVPRNCPMGLPRFLRLYFLLTCSVYGVAGIPHFFLESRDYDRPQGQLHIIWFHVMIMPPWC